MGRTETAMPKTRHIAATIGALVVMLAGVLFAGTSPANAAMTSTNCVWATSNWSNVKICTTITYHQPTASKYQIDKIRVEAFSYGDTKRISYGLVLWDDGDSPGWNRPDQKLNADNGWDQVYNPNDLYVTVAGDGDGISNWGRAYFESGGSGDFYGGAGIG